LIEIKPYNQSVLPKATKRKNPTKLLNETLIVKRNLDKWNAAVKFCKNKRLAFSVSGQKNGINQMC
jgi:hypothetical protein